MIQAGSAGCHDSKDSKAQHSGCRHCVFPDSQVVYVVAVTEHGHLFYTRHRFLENFQTFLAQFQSIQSCPGYVASWTGKALDDSIATRSPAVATTIGIVFVARFAAIVAGVTTVTMTSGASCTRLAASLSKIWAGPSPKRYSIMRFWPST